MSQTVYGLFKEAAEARPDSPAIIEEGRTLSFRELSDLTDRIAGTFPRNVRSVGVVMRRRSEMIAALLAALKCGARYVPAEPAFPRGRIRYMMNDAGAEFVLTEKEFEERLAGLPTRLADCEICELNPSGEIREPSARPEDPAYVLYTSGTTGNPKGVCVTNANVCHYVRAFENEFHAGPGDVVLQHSVCSFDIFVEEVFGSLLNGAALAMPPKEAGESLQNLMDFVERRGVTVISGFPYLLAEMNHLPSIPSSLRLLISGGDVLRAVYVDRLTEQAQVYNTYGPSETTVCATYYRCNSGRVLEDGTYPIGRAVQGTRVRVLDPAGNELPQGEVGEICISGDGVSLGYVGDREEENRAFTTLANGERTYRSGDLGYVLPDGNIAFLRRKDTQIMIRGKRVEVAEVESRLYRCDGVAQALVRPFLDEEGLSYMTAYVVPAGKGVRLSDIRRELAEDLPPFMIPEFFVSMPSIPLNANGKPDAAALPVVLKSA